MERDEIIRLAKECHIMDQRDDYLPNGLERFAELVAAPLQAKIDALMLEFCPEEMTQEQVDNWMKHQVKAPLDLFTCPNCGGDADNGFSREIPPSPYWCTKCMEQTK